MSPAPDRWSASARASAVTLLVLLLSVLAWAWPALDAGVRASLLFAEGVVGMPLRPSGWFAPDPTSETLAWDHEGRGLLVRPGDAAWNPAPGLLLVLGADPAPPDDPRVERLLDTLARLGFAVLLPLSAPLERGVVGAAEVPRLVEAYRTLEAQPGVSGHVGFAGLSAGGSLAIVAAAEPAIAERVAFVLAIGPYFDAATLVASTAAGAYRGPEGVVSWTPHRTTVEVVGATLDDAGIGEALLQAGTLEAVEARLAALEPSQLEGLRAVSPRHAVARLEAPLYLLHDRNDEFVPWVESERLVEAYPATVYHRLDLFEHVEPRVGNLGVLGRDGWRLLRLFARIFREAR